MTIPILAIRPEPGCSATVAAGRALGLTIEAYPLLEIRPVSWARPSGDFDGLLLGSANALRHGGPPVDKLVDKPVYAVGETTAEAANERGFAIARSGRGGLQDLLDSLAGQRLNLLRLAGRERAPLAPPSGISIATAIVYESLGLPLPVPLAERLNRGALVLLHSSGAARHFIAECDRLAVQRRDIRLAALSPRIAEAAGSGWAALRSAGQPNEAALLALAREMCHDLPRGMR
jgi:uroporphyrinogen-III synthase